SGGAGGLRPAGEGAAPAAARAGRAVGAPLGARAPDAAGAAGGAARVRIRAGLLRGAGHRRDGCALRRGARRARGGGSAVPRGGGGDQLRHRRGSAPRVGREATPVTRSRLTRERDASATAVPLPVLRAPDASRRATR